MDWIELLLIAVFFGAPLLGRLFQRQQPAPPPTQPRDDSPGYAEAPAEAPTRLPAPARATLPTPVGGWSAGWGEWPEGASKEENEVEEGAEDEEGVVGDHDLAADSIHTREAISLEPVTASEVALRPLPEAPVALDGEVDRSREHLRFHDKYFKPPPPPPRMDRLADHLRSRAEVRRAILLAEVLGPPRSLRGLEDER
ncbi:MAG TPA: hypothetical protein VK399_03625 [Longimicrobiaceae bacterium]|jgi:hypothetical protein|nr:hypothetical protein [Longimicrobiaceae bacterium]